MEMPRQSRSTAAEGERRNPMTAGEAGPEAPGSRQLQDRLPVHINDAGSTWRGLHRSPRSLCAPEPTHSRRSPLRAPTAAEIQQVVELCASVKVLASDLRASGFGKDDIAREFSEFDLQEIGSSQDEEEVRTSSVVPEEVARDRGEPQHHQEFRTKAKQLHQILCSSPTWDGWDGTLSEYEMSIIRRPFRATPGLLDRKLKFWMERDTSAADSSLFTSFGVWKSPKLALVLVVGGLATLTLGIEQFMIALSPNFPKTGCIKTTDEYCSLNHTTAVVNTIYDFSSTVCMWSIAILTTFYGDLKNAQRMAIFFGYILAPGFYISGGVGTFCGCLGDYYKDFTPLMGFAYFVIGFICYFTITAVVFFKRQSFYGLFGGGTMLCILATAILFFIKSWVVGVIVGMTTVTLIVIGSRYLISRKRALIQAADLADADAERYHRCWNNMKAAEGFVTSLDRLAEAWAAAMGSASCDAKAQVSATFEDLFHEADLLAPLVHTKAMQLAAKHGGIAHTASVKAERRALQKVWRTYGGDWRRVCDLARTSIEFSDISSLIKCLSNVALDPELELLRVDDGKMRLTNNAEVEATGGYRDVQLCARLNTKEARDYRIEHHLFEIQLHISLIYNLKSEGGHKSYVLARNLRGN